MTVAPELVAALGTPCPYCGATMTKGKHRPSRDCTISKRNGGSYAAENVTIVCEPCNLDKGHWNLSGFHAALKAQDDPRAVHVAAVIERRKGKGLPV